MLLFNLQNKNSPSRNKKSYKTPVLPKIKIKRVATLKSSENSNLDSTPTKNSKLMIPMSDRNSEIINIVIYLAK